jgi:hypothetical protein
VAEKKSHWAVTKEDWDIILALPFNEELRKIVEGLQHFNDAELHPQHVSQINSILSGPGLHYQVSINQRARFFAGRNSCVRVDRPRTYRLFKTVPEK